MEFNLYLVILINKNVVFIWEYYFGFYFMWLKRYRLLYIILSEI